MFSSYSSAGCPVFLVLCYLGEERYLIKLQQPSLRSSYDHVGHDSCNKKYFETRKHQFSSYNNLRTLFSSHTRRKTGVTPLTSVTLHWWDQELKTFILFYIVLFLLNVIVMELHTITNMWMNPMGK